MFLGKFADEGDNLENNPNIYNVEGNNRLMTVYNRLSPGL